ncbi:MAG: aquaporin [Pirellulaceae bacterium]
MTQQPRTLAACSIAEAIGTFLLVFFGCGAVHTAVLTGELTGLWQVGAVWGVAIMLAIYSIGAISGAHINPAITTALACWGLFPKQRVPAYVMAQLFGAFFAAAALYCIYSPFLQAKERQKGVTRGQPGSEITAMCYGEYFPNPGPMAGGVYAYSPSEHEFFNTRVTELGACLAEVMGTAILAFMVVALTEGRNPVGPRFMAPVFIGLTVTALICVIAPLTQACFNPARDFGPRLFAYFAGWGPIAIPGPRGAGIFTVYILSPLVGGVLGVGVYQCLVRPMVAPLLRPQEDSNS